MANTIQIKYSDTLSAVPSSLADGELAINRRDKKLFYTDHLDAVQSLNLAASGGGITRSISTPSSAPAVGNAANTDYVYLCTGTFSLTLPTAIGNSNRYTIKNVGVGVITINTTSSQNIEESLTATLNPKASVDVVSDNANWWII